ncbi:Mitochondrial substrate/solute carrier [Sesbania bispinosa]|nr:Mitochondrial substrate/solute carrier [Sesbania bispinosa]
MLRRKQIGRNHCFLNPLNFSATSFPQNMNLKACHQLLLSSRPVLSRHYQANCFLKEIQKRLENMSGCNKSPKHDQHSIKYWGIQHGGASFQADLSCVQYSPSLSHNENKQKQCCRSSQQKSPEILSTAQLISAICQIWDSASRPLSFLLLKKNGNQDDKGLPKEKILDSIDEKRKNVVTSNKANYYPVNMEPTGFGSQIVQEKLHFPKVTQKMLVLESSNESQDYIYSLFQRFLLASNKNPNKYWKEMELGSEEISFRSGNGYWRMSRNAPKGLNCHAKVTEPEDLKTDSLVAGGCISTGTSTPALPDESDVYCPDFVIHEAQQLSNDAILDHRKVSPLCSDYFLQAMPDTKEDVSACQTLSSSIYADYHINSLAACSSASVQCQHNIDDNELPEIQRKHFSEISDHEPKVQIFSETHQKPCHFLAKQEHAFSGALAGICVSLCLHPFDTIKTVIQSCRAEHRSIFYIGKSIVSDRGWGAVLCRNIPHSIVKFYTYESLKQAMPSNIQSNTFQTLVCGGLAGSTAALFTTPFDVIKTRLQTQIPGSMNQYDSVLHALYKISKSEGLKGLYRGLTPRLIMYMSQGSLFFASYEFFKRVFSLEASPPTDNKNVENRKNLELTSPSFIRSCSRSIPKP